MTQRAFNTTQTGRPFCSARPTVASRPLLILLYDSSRLGDGPRITSTGADYTIPMPPVVTQAQPAGALPNDLNVHASSVYELRRLTGLTWEHLSELLGVSRQAVNDWANGKPIKSANSEKLLRLVAAFRALAATSAAERRGALLHRMQDGSRPLDLLRDGSFDAGVAAVAGYRPTSAPLAPRSPDKPHPADLLARNTDRPLPVTGEPVAKRSRRLRAARS